MTCTVVLGCYRSGTSAVAGVLHHLGVSMGDRFQEPNSKNPHGYYEDLDFVECHVYMRDCGMDMDEKYKALVERRETAHTDWGVKDPRLCYLLPELVKHIRHGHQVIVVNRSMMSICDSMARAIYNGTEPKRLMPLVMNITEAQNESLDQYGGEILHVDFLTLMYSTETEVERIANFVSKPITDKAVESINKI